MFTTFHLLKRDDLLLFVVVRDFKQDSRKQLDIIMLRIHMTKMYKIVKHKTSVIWKKNIFFKR